MKRTHFLLLSFFLGLAAQSAFAKNADVICTYRERVRMDVTQPAHTQSVTHKDATDIDCCSETDEECKHRLKQSAINYCSASGRVPSGYKLSQAKVICGEGFLGGKEGISYTPSE